jgi:sec-independent protein translocase protein TatC
MALVPFPGSQPGAYYPPSDDDEDDDGSGPKMSFLEHLDELRKRIINALLGVVVGVFVSFAFIERIVNFIWGPMRKVLPPDIKLIYTEPAEAFSLYIQISLLAGALLAAPWVMWQVWLFISPGLHSNEKKFALPFVLFTTVGLLCGAAFNHYIAFPFMMRFLASFSGVDLVFMPKISETFDMYLKMAAGMAIVFQLPTVVFFLAKLNLVSARFLWSKGKYAILIAFIIGAVVTPTGDPINQTIFAAPIVVLYFLSIIIAWVVGPVSRKKGPPAD